MIILLPITILLFTCAALFALPRLRPGFSSAWLLAVGGAFLAWGSTFFQYTRLPDSITLASWRPADMFALSPELLIDEISWPLGLAIVTIALSMLLIDVRRAATAKIFDWILVLGFAALGMLSIFSANWLTLALLWTILDFSMIFIYWSHSPGSINRAKLTFPFSANLVSVLLLIATIMVSSSAQSNGEIDLQITNISSTLLVFVIVIRLLSTSFLFKSKATGDDSINLFTNMKLVSAAVTLLLILRIELFGINVNFLPYQTTILLLVAFYSGLRWALAKDFHAGRPYWILSTSLIVFTAVLLFHALIAVLWVLVLLYLGIFATITQKDGKRGFSFAAMILLASVVLPYIPTFIGNEKISNVPAHFLIGFVAIQALLIFGYVNKIIRLKRKQNGDERWIKIISMIGLALLPVTFIGSSLYMNIFNNLQLEGATWWPAGLIIGMLATLTLISRWNVSLPAVVQTFFDRIFSFQWLADLFTSGLKLMQNFINMITELLEGEGGMLWALLLVAMLATLLVQVQAGG